MCGRRPSKIATEVVHLAGELSIASVANQACNVGGAATPASPKHSLTPRGRAHECNPGEVAVNTRDNDRPRHLRVPLAPNYNEEAASLATVEIAT